MPKKTKKQKLASQHRRTQLASRPDTYSPTVAEQKSPPPLLKYSLTAKATAQQLTPTPAVTDNFRAITRDLGKTLILAVVAISIELALYFQIK